MVRIEDLSWEFIRDTNRLHGIFCTTHEAGFSASYIFAGAYTCLPNPRVLKSGESQKILRNPLEKRSTFRKQHSYKTCRAHDYLFFLDHCTTLQYVFHLSGRLNRVESEVKQSWFWNLVPDYEKNRLIIQEIWGSLWWGSKSEGSRPDNPGELAGMNVLCVSPPLPLPHLLPSPINYQFLLWCSLISREFSRWLSEIGVLRSLSYFCLSFVCVFVCLFCKKKSPPPYGHVCIYNNEPALYGQKQKRLREKVE